MPTNKNLKNNAGFGAVEILVIVAAVALLSVVGFLVFKNLNNTGSSDSAGTAEKTDTQEDETPAPSSDPYAGWKTYSHPSLAVSFRYPGKWTVTSGQPACTGAVLTTATPPEAEIASAAKEIRNEKLKKYVVSINQFGTQSGQCPPDGNNFKGSAYPYLQSSDTLTDGAFRHNNVTFFGGTAGGTSAPLPDTGIVTATNYVAQGAFEDAGTVSWGGKTFQITINTDPVQMDVSRLKQTGLYKDTLLLLNSIQ